MRNHPRHRVGRAQRQCRLDTTLQRNDHPSLHLPQVPPIHVRVYGGRVPDFFSRFDTSVTHHAATFMQQSRRLERGLRVRKHHRFGGHTPTDQRSGPPKGQPEFHHNEIMQCVPEKLAIVGVDPHISKGIMGIPLTEQDTSFRITST